MVEAQLLALQMEYMEIGLSLILAQIGMYLILYKMGVGVYLAKKITIGLGKAGWKRAKEEAERCGY